MICTIRRSSTCKVRNALPLGASLDPEYDRRAFFTQHKRCVIPTASQGSQGLDNIIAADRLCCSSETRDRARENKSPVKYYIIAIRGNLQEAAPFGFVEAQGSKK